MIPAADGMNNDDGNNQNWDFGAGTTGGFLTFF